MTAAPPSSATSAIEFIDLRAQRARLGDRVDAAIARVLEHGRFIMGPEVAELEGRLAEFCGVRHAISCSSGTDALLMALLALRIGPGDAVLVPTFTFAATAEVVALVGATPVFIDVLPSTANLDPAGLVGALHAARVAGTTPRALIAVDLYGQPADYDEIEGFCNEYDLALVADAAQSFGATWRTRRARGDRRPRVHELLSGETPRLLRRRGRGVHQPDPVLPLPVTRAEIASHRRGGLRTEVLHDPHREGRRDRHLRQPAARGRPRGHELRAQTSSSAP